MTAHRRPGQLAVDPADGKAAETGASPAPARGNAGGTGRRRFLGYLLAGPTLMAAAPLGGTLLAPSKASAASASVPSNPQVADTYDLNDALTDAAMPTSNLITVQVNSDGTASFALPRNEVGQGITTAIAMLIAEEMDLSLDKVHMSLADARPELVFNQLTGGSNTLNAMYTPVRVAAAIAKGRLLDAAAAELGQQVSFLTSKLGVITGPAGQSLSYGQLARRAATAKTKKVSTQLKPASKFTIVGKPQKRIDAMDIVTGRKQFTMDLDVPGAKPAMVCRPPTINGTVRSVGNLAAVRAMPGITDVVPISTGVAVRGETFGQCIDAVRALHVTWGPGPVDHQSDDSVVAELKAATPPMPPAVPGTTVDAGFVFAFASNSALEPNCAIADVRSDRAEIWSSVKVPIVAKHDIAQMLGLPDNAVTVHVTLGGGSFGRKLFHDAAAEAAEASQKMGKPVKLMWHRTDDFRQGRTHPMSYSRIQAIYAAGQVLSYQQHHTSVRTSFSHGLGEAITSTASRAPLAGLTLSESIFELSQTSPYEFGPTKQLLNEIYQSEQDNQPHGGFNTGSMRNVYSPNVCCAQELVVDELAARMGQDRYRFRRSFAKDDKFRTVLDRAADAGGWGRALPKGVGQGIAVHREYKQTMACFVELDCRPQTTKRKVRDAVTGPRVTRAVYVTIPGSTVVNPLGMEAMLQGGFMDGLALALTSGLHLKNGTFLEGSWDNYFYTREWNTPEQLQVIILAGDPADEVPGSGEASVAASFAAVACAYGAATGTMPTYFPINHNGPLGFPPEPTVPPIPESPTDGLKFAY
jgi:isoquinoline 1-oxidoreductase subunit beta